MCLEHGGPDDGMVWLVLHSGSRNIGKELAEWHMAVARGLPRNAGLPDRDLAVFLAGTRGRRRNSSTAMMSSSFM